MIIIPCEEEAKVTVRVWNHSYTPRSYLYLSIFEHNKDMGKDIIRHIEQKFFIYFCCWIKIGKISCMILLLKMVADWIG